MVARPPNSTGPSSTSGLSGSLLERLREAVGFPELPPADDSHGRRNAAVLLLFDSSSERLPLLFTLRSPDLRDHAGQISFPGGSTEAADQSTVATALREAREEVGIPPENVEVIGLLSPLVTAVSDRWLTPVVGLQRKPWDVIIDTSEVAEWFRIDLATLMATPHEVRYLERAGIRHPVHFYEADSRVIWGVSAAILHDLMSRLGRTD